MFIPFYTSGGSLSDTDALLIVHAPANALVTLNKNGVTLTPVVFAVSGRITAEENIFIINSGSFDSNAWTVTASKNSDTWTGNIVINAAGVYQLDTVIHVPVSIYQEIEYIETTGTQYIAMTGTYDSLWSGYTSLIKFQATAFDNNNPVLQHGITNAAKKEGNVCTNTTAYAAWFNHNIQSLISSSDTGIVTASVYNSNTFVKCDMSTENNSASYTWNISAADYTGGTFICRNGRSTYQYGKYKVFYYQMMRDNNTLSRQLYPCYRISDNVIGFYDKISGIFFTNVGTGTFIKGSDI